MKYLLLPAILFILIAGTSASYKTKSSGASRHTDSLARFSLLKKAESWGVSGQAVLCAFNGSSMVCDSLQKKVRYLVIMDLTKPSTEKRFFVVDREDTSLVCTNYVAHGKHSGELYANEFSNEISSYKSSLGFYLISEQYDGCHGLSIRLDGLDVGFNDNARNRAVVIHAADYANPAVIPELGRLGRSHGCPALPTHQYTEIANTLSGNALLFVYYPSQQYLQNSVWLKYGMQF